MSENADLAAKIPPVPRDLSAKSRRFWRETLAIFELNPVEMRVFEQLCRALDDLAELSAVVRRDGVTVMTADGAAKVNPALIEARQQRMLAAKLATVLDLPDLPDSDDDDDDAP